VDIATVGIGSEPFAIGKTVTAAMMDSEPAGPMSHQSGWVQQRSVTASLAGRIGSSGGSCRGAREAGVMHLANFPEGGAGFGAAGLTSWSTTIRTDGAQQVGDAVVAGRMFGCDELGAIHRPHQH
jgi:hypothetical protein